MLSKLREPVNGLTHLISAVAAFCGLFFLLALSWGNPVRVIGAGVFGLSLTLMFLASGLYHSVKGSPAVINRLRMFDHAAIFLLIAGTYTPICLLYLSGGWRWGFLGTVWSLAFIGSVVKSFIYDAPRGLTAGVYLVMGWMVVVAINQFLQSVPAAVIFWIAAGGAFYTVGAIGYILKRPVLKPGVFGFHELWHVFVILAGASHYIGIAMAISSASV